MRHLSLTYHLSNEHVCIIKKNQVVSQECYLNNLAVVRQPLTLTAVLFPGMDDFDVEI